MALTDINVDKRFSYSWGEGKQDAIDDNGNPTVHCWHFLAYNGLNRATLVRHNAIWHKNDWCEWSGTYGVVSDFIY